MLLIQVLINSLVSMIQVLLLAAGLYLVYTVTRIFHVGLVGVLLFGAYSLFLFKNLLALPMISAVVLTLLLTTLLSGGSYFLLRDMARKKQNLLGLLLSITFWLIIEALIAIFFGSDAKFVNNGVLPGYYFAGLQITVAGLINLVVGFILVLIALFVIYLMPAGRVLRATHQHPEAANFVGIRSSKVQILTFCIAGALAGITGILVGLNRGISPTSFTHILVAAFMSFIVGGVNNFKGTIVATVILVTIPELLISISIAQFSIPSTWNMVITFVLAMAILYFKPEGILYQQTRKS